MTAHDKVYRFYRINSGKSVFKYIYKKMQRNRKVWHIQRKKRQAANTVPEEVQLLDLLGRL